MNLILVIIFQLVNNYADFAVSNFGFTLERSTAACLSSPVSVGYMTWITKAPDKLPNTTALVRIFQTSVWALVFAVAFFFSAFLVAAKKLGIMYGMDFKDYEDFLVPFR